MHKTRWLNRQAAMPLPYLCLCLSEEEFFAAAKHMKVPVSDWGRWVSEPGMARTNYFNHKNGDLCCVVCIDILPNYQPVAIAALLVHEAVHVWQQYAKSIGESRPADEQEAYAIQGISQELLGEYARRISIKRKKS